MAVRKPLRTPNVVHTTPVKESPLNVVAETKGESALLGSLLVVSAPKQAPHTPLSKAVAEENVRRDARISAAYKQRRDKLLESGKLYTVKFADPGHLGFKILLARGTRSTRRRVLVDATFESCIAYDLMRPHDEIVAVDDDLLIEMDPEAFAALVKKLRTKRPLELTLAKADDREHAFNTQKLNRLLNHIKHKGLPNFDQGTTFCGCFNPNFAVDNLDYTAGLTDKSLCSPL